MSGPDQPILEAIVDHRPDVLVAVMRAVTELGSFWFLWILGLTVAAIWRVRVGDWVAARVLAITAATAWSASHLLKWLVDRDRPAAAVRLVEATGSAFPSGHATQSAAMYGALAVLWTARHPEHGRSAFGIATIIAIGVGISRIYLGVHWTSDVLAGWALGATVVVLLARRLVGGTVTTAASIA